MKALHQTPSDDRMKREARLLKEGRKKYIRELNKQLQQLRHWTEDTEPEDTSETARRFYRIVHTLKGSAPMFGFTRIGVLAEKLVGHWEWSQDEEAVASPSVRVRFRQCSQASLALVLELELEIDTIVRELEPDEQQGQLQRTLTPPQGERLLVIDDDDVLRAYLVRRLKLDGYEVDEAADVSSAQRLIRERSYDLISLDLMMHPGSGYELFEFLKEDPNLKLVPLIVLSGRSDVYDKVRCFYLGADDYVVKPFQYEELAARIYSLLKRTKTFEQMAFRDPLTGVYNRRYFDHQIQVELQRVARYPGTISMVFIDIDRFKSINDTYGHPIGDLVLQGLAYLLQANLRATDLIARFGGEEFVVVLPGTSAADAKKTIEGILRLTHQGPVAQNEGQSFHITFSAGVSEWRPDLTLSEWIRRADDAMYEAKQNGRNRVMLYTGDAAGAETDAAARKTVLIADDDNILRSILMAKLKHLPIDFKEAADGEEAYLELLGSPVDLCILDGVMPRLDGYGVLERMRERGTRPPHTKVLVLSGRSRDEDTSRGMQLGANAYMHKPFSMVELELKVKELLELS